MNPSMEDCRGKPLKRTWHYALCWKRDEDTILVIRLAAEKSLMPLPILKT
jgi:hypothetical protein